MSQPSKRTSFLDVSQYILKECSPLCKPISVDNRIQERIYIQDKNTPEIGPIDHDASTLKITPFLNGLIQIADQHLQQFYLDCDNDSPVIKAKDRKHRYERMNKNRKNSLVILHLQNELWEIDEEDDGRYEDYSSCPQDCSSQQQDEPQQSQQSISIVQKQPDNALRLQIEAYYQQKIQKFSKDPKQSLIKMINKLSNNNQIQKNQKIAQLKKIIEGYLIQFQMPYFQQNWKNLSQIKQIITILNESIQNSFKRKIGPITFQSRRLKLLKYLQKKRLRRWRKKVSYDCRKKVADSRLRIKGKFVTREQICDQLGLQMSALDHYTSDQIRQLLQNKGQHKQGDSIKLNSH